MSTFVITIATSSDAFAGNPVEELRRILHEVELRLEDYPAIAEGVLRDCNGNSVGMWGFEPDKENHDG